MERAGGRAGGAYLTLITGSCRKLCTATRAATAEATDPNALAEAESGRDATTAELEELGGLLLPEAGEISIVGEERHELADSVELVLRQVRVAIPPDRVPKERDERKAFCERLVGLAEIWARRCIEERHADISEL